MLYGDVLTSETMSVDLLCHVQIMLLCVDYMGPSPPQGSGFHRYCLYLFEQPNEDMHFDAVPENRAHFNPEEFASKYSLGEPVAVNFFIAEFKEMEKAEVAEYQ